MDPPTAFVVSVAIICTTIIVMAWITIWLELAEEK